MTKKMLIDAAHPEQTRVAIVDGNRVEEFDFESRQKKQLRGNIYLAKVTRVEASLQAAFVEYGGNRHGFLAFNEIHPDYYQIPIEDRKKLLEEEAHASQELSDTDEPDVDESDEEAPDSEKHVEADETEVGEIAEEAVRKRKTRKPAIFRRYKIQEVIKPGQILLVQVVKEERGTKGAALTTYLSLAGRYCVLMPNTAKGGGISRKITNAADRKRLKGITGEMDVRDGMGLIIRTAGSKRNKTEIKRDYQYLLRLWDEIRDKTLESVAPCMVHEEGGLVRRAVRDLYDKDIDSILVEGEDAYKEAKSFMKTLMPSHTGRIKHYHDKHPLFLRHQVEDQLETVHTPEVQLKSGGYLVIHQTEALVAIDVNSGRATKERNIEATALKTNLEAAEEACRQMRLRDLAGLIVIDFIDMEESKNNRAVEKRMKDSLKQDRARVQVGRISGFGLFEMSRQRRRASVIEGTTQVCPTCNGMGVVRSTESSALQALHAIESESMSRRSGTVRLTAPTEVALYILNQKRAQLAEIEADTGIKLLIQTNPDMHPPQHTVEYLGDSSTNGQDNKSESRPSRRNRGKPRTEPEPQEVAQETPVTQSEDETEDDADKPRKSRRRGRRGGRGRRRNTQDAVETVETQSTEATAEPATTSPEIATDTQETDNKPKRRRRKPAKAKESVDEQSAPTPEEQPAPEAESVSSRPRRTKRLRPSAKTETSTPDIDQVAETPAKDTKPKRTRKPRKTASSKAEEPSSAAETTTDPAPKPKRTRRPRKSATNVAEPDSAASSVSEVKEEKPKRTRTKRKTVVAEEPTSSEEKPAAKPKRTRKPASTKAEAPAEAAEPARKPRAKTKTPAEPAPEPDAGADDASSTGTKKKRSWRTRLFGAKGD